MLARSFLSGNSSIALEKLCLPEPLPVPIFLSCWDLADFLKLLYTAMTRATVRLDVVVPAQEEMTDRLIESVR